MGTGINIWRHYAAGIGPLSCMVFMARHHPALPCRMIKWIFSPEIDLIAFTSIKNDGKKNAFKGKEMSNEL